MVTRECNHTVLEGSLLDKDHGRHRRDRVSQMVMCMLILRVMAVFNKFFSMGDSNIVRI